MTVVKLSYQLKLTNHTNMYICDECQIKVGSHCMSDQHQGERRKLTARYEALVTSYRRLTPQWCKCTYLKNIYSTYNFTVPSPVEIRYQIDIIYYIYSILST